MTWDLFFWIVFIVAIFGGGYVYWPSDRAGAIRCGHGLLIVLLIFILGWRVFGPIVHDDSRTEIRSTH